MMPSIMSGSLIRETPPWARMSAGTRSSAITATAPASSAIFACSAVTTSMITPPLSISAMPRFTRVVPVPSARGARSGGGGFSGCSTMPRSYVRHARGRPTRGRLRRRGSAASACWRTTQTRWTTVTVLASASTHSATYIRTAGRRSPKPGHHQDRHEPVGALGDADLGVEAERLGAGPGVGRDRRPSPGRPGTARGRAGCRRRRRSRARGRRRSRRRRSGRAWSRGRRRRGRCGPSCGPCSRR